MNRPLALAIVPGSPLVVLTRGEEVPIGKLTREEARALVLAAQQAVMAICEEHPVLETAVEDVAVAAGENFIRSLFSGVGGRRRRRAR